MKETVWTISVYDYCTGGLRDDMDGYGRKFKSKNEAKAYCMKMNNWVHEGGFLTVKYVYRSKKD